MDEKLVDQTIERLQQVIDPELGVNIWDLGLVYDLGFGTSDAGRHLELKMTLTSAACPLSDIIEEELGKALDGLFDSYKVNWVWMPPWDPSRISDEGREMLRALGFQL
jgi:metal-sulfur cluster biosynthetic enzyme